MQRINPMLYWSFLPVLIATLYQQPVDKCEQAKAASSKLTALAASRSFNTAITILRDAGKDGHEHLFVFGRDTIGTIILSTLKTSGTKNAVTADPGFTGAFADIHNHPGNTTPSAGDLYSLISANDRNPLFDSRITVLKNGGVYALAVISPASAIGFMAKYPPEQTPGFSPRFPGKLFNEFADLKSYLISIKAVEKTQADEIATAYILDKYESGVALLRLDNNNRFGRVYVIEENDNTQGKNYILHTCSTLP